MKNLVPFPQVISANGMYLTLKDGRRILDAISSWWCAIHGYNHPELNDAVLEQINKFSHVMLGSLTHEPALKLAEKLSEITPGDLKHVFFSDSGSVGVEVALKMAIQYWLNLGKPKKAKFLSLQGAYHGDTFQTMSICSPDNSFHRIFSSVLPRHYYLAAPRDGYFSSDKILQGDLRALENILHKESQNIAAFVVEPILQGAGGYYYYNPKYLTLARELCDSYDVLFIFDEIATGFGRTGTLFAAEQTGICPDIMVLGKALTAGYFGHAATIASCEIFDSFLGDDDKTLMHGPTYMANATILSVALKGIEIFFRDNYLDKIKKIEAQLREEIIPIQDEIESKNQSSKKIIKECRVLGASGVVEVTDRCYLDGLQKFALDRGVFLRPFGNIVYTAPAYIIKSDELSKISQVLQEWFMKISLK
jgi:adenosylmethionine-8-amino-7-oxononanoate aminotransferase